ncbi:hypothetical protein PYCCODRAFT_1430076, partial [Trametes coccinea BRFM310]
MAGQRGGGGPPRLPFCPDLLVKPTFSSHPVFLPSFFPIFALFSLILPPAKRQTVLIIFSPSPQQVLALRFPTSAEEALERSHQA